MTQISNEVFCEDFLLDFDIQTKLLPNPYYDLPFLIIEDFFTQKECELINEIIKDDDDFEKAQVLIQEAVVTSKTNEKIRKTNIYKLDNILLNLYNERFNSYQKQIEDYFKLAISSSTNVQVLEYKKDSFYMMHSDDSSMLFKDEKLVGFVPVTNERKVSTVLFTTSCEDEIDKNSFQGGELLFNFLYDINGNQIKVKPKAGNMVVFLSNPYFTHEVLKVKQGRRISLVQWHNAIVN
ncbi:hypothetical protein GCM10012288_15800 [Malaciobacter pacificus]|jgi:SM-20-related protein|uniref:2OG-Fe(II) oxygenase family protein n=1 Tax=Malaciobacter pacificus TaxID=1080223 RepID=A0A5C2HDM8_9BACT|nr:2OG-Fe(II) oxygenase [Malaciobacter pacificus]QEP35266.1 2OG-Fe(II) oxygenase family protein [Malaciobacter pacificus]GGD42371.1 hypothetical protein GCM10012288_15800 [Malaciobacter pacificus]